MAPRAPAPYHRAMEAAAGALAAAHASRLFGDLDEEQAGRSRACCGPSPPPGWRRCSASARRSSGSCSSVRLGRRRRAGRSEPSARARPLGELALNGPADPCRDAPPRSSRWRASSSRSGDFGCSAPTRDPLAVAVLRGLARLLARAGPRGRRGVRRGSGAIRPAGDARRARARRARVPPPARRLPRRRRAGAGRAAARLRTWRLDAGATVSPRARRALGVRRRPRRGRGHARPRRPAAPARDRRPGPHARRAVAVDGGPRTATCSRRSSLTVVAELEGELVGDLLDDLEGGFAVQAI